MNFTVYSKKGCPYCDKIKTVLSDLSVKKGYPVICYELGTDFTREEFYAEFEDDDVGLEFFVCNSAGNIIHSYLGDISDVPTNDIRLRAEFSRDT